jgi:SAM-dependent methyltransferase
MADQSIAFDRAADFYDQTRGFPPGEETSIAALIADAGGWLSSSRILEVGIGTGRIALPLATYVQAVYGVDLALPMMLRLRSKTGGGSIHLAQADASRLPFPHHSFDGVVVVHVLHLIPNWRDVLSEIARVLRPGAALVHGWTTGNDSFQGLWDVFNTTVRQTPEYSPVGAPWRSNPNFLEDEGWQPTAPAKSYTYNYTRTPNYFIEQARNRVWSALWRLSDDDLARGVAALETAIGEQYPDLDIPVTAQSTFYAQAYLPPE